jgi:hypothetical protein
MLCYAVANVTSFQVFDITCGSTSSLFLNAHLLLYNSTRMSLLLLNIFLTRITQHCFVNALLDVTVAFAVACEQYATYHCQFSKPTRRRTCGLETVF